MQSMTRAETFLSCDIGYRQRHCTLPFNAQFTSIHNFKKCAKMYDDLSFKYCFAEGFTITQSVPYNVCDNMVSECYTLIRMVCVTVSILSGVD